MKSPLDRFYRLRLRQWGRWPVDLFDTSRKWVVDYLPARTGEYIAKGKPENPALMDAEDFWRRGQERRLPE